MDHKIRLFAPLQGLISVILILAAAIPFVGGSVERSRAAEPSQSTSHTGRGPSRGNAPQAAFTDCSSQSQIPLAECQALVALYQGTNGASWANRTDWLITDTPCSWYGITCSLGNVHTIILNGNGLNGAIPAALGDLSHLETLDLNTNQITGTIPSQLENLGDLTQLVLYDNQLSGSIPYQLGNLSNLEILSLQTNHLTGSIPAQLGSLGNLTDLWLSDNQLTGSIPPQLGNLASLNLLALRENQITGTIPGELGNLANVKYLVLANNRLEGGIPPALGGIANLRGLWLENNQLDGEIPPELTGLGSLTDLDLGYNRLSASDANLLAFLDTRDPDWPQTQTVAPTGLSGAPGVTSVALTWTPILYTGHGGYYEVSYATGPGGPFTVHGLTPDKFTASYTADSLTSNTLYYFRLRTYTPAHGLQQNALWSTYTTNLPATTDQQCYTLTTAVSPAGWGTMTSLPAANCAAGKYLDGAQVRLSATPAAGYKFTGWTGDAISSATPFTITMDSNKSITATFKLMITAVTPPYLQNFEAGALDNHWETETTGQGRVRISQNYRKNGIYGLLLDDSTDDSIFSTASVILHANPATDTWLRFWWRGFYLENRPETGVFIRSRSSDSWCKVMPFESSSTAFQESWIDLKASAQTCGMSLTDDFQIRFQFYGKGSIPTSGLAFDDIELTTQKIYNVFLPLIKKVE